MRLSKRQKKNRGRVERVAMDLLRLGLESAWNGDIEYSNIFPMNKPVPLKDFKGTTVEALFRSKRVKNAFKRYLKQVITYAKGYADERDL